MSTFERYLTLWVALCIVVGIALGHLMPGLFQMIGAAEIAKVNLPVALLIWLMVIPMLLKVHRCSTSTVVVRRSRTEPVARTGRWRHGRR